MIRAAVLLAILMLIGCLMSLNGESKPAPSPCEDFDVDSSVDTCKAPLCYPDIQPRFTI